MDPFLTLSGITLGGMLCDWLASKGEVVTDAAVGRVIEALRGKSPQIPANHDLRRASRDALLDALRILHQALETWRDGKGSPATLEERHWIDRLDHWLTTTGKSAVVAETANAFDAFDAAFVPDPKWATRLAAIGKDAPFVGGADGGPCRKMVERFGEAAVEWLGLLLPGTEHSTLPAVVASWLRDGFDYTPPAAWWRRLVGGEAPAAMRVRLFEVWAQAFFERLKDGQRGFRAFLLEGAIAIRDEVSELKALLVTESGAFRFTGTAEEQFETIVESTRGLEQSFADLAGFSRAAFAETFRRLSKTTSGMGMVVALSHRQGEQLDEVVAVLERQRGVLEAVAHTVNEQHQIPFREGAEVAATEATGTDVGIGDLRYTRRWLPVLLGRGPERAALWDFLDRDDPFLWWGMVGEGGTGKSRLAQELVREARERGWRAGFLERGDGMLRVADHSFHLWRPEFDTLVVVDYASYHAADIPTCLAKLHSVAGGGDWKPGRRLRLLLLDRPGAVGPLFSELSSGLGGKIDDERSQARRCCHRADSEAAEAAGDGFGAEADLLRLDPLPPAEWPSFLAEVVRRAGGMWNAEWDTNGDALWAAVDRLTASGRPLLLQAFGLALVRRGEVPRDDASALALLDDLLRTEVFERWSRLLPGGADPIDFLPRFQCAVGIVTLCRGLDLTLHAEALRKAVGFGDERDRGLLVVLRRLLGEEEAVNADGGPGGRRVRPLEPDLFGERFLVHGGFGERVPDTVFPEPPPFDTGELVAEWFERETSGIVETLQLLMRDFPEEAAVWVAVALGRVSPPDLPSDWADRNFDDPELIPAIVSSPAFALTLTVLGLARKNLSWETGGVAVAIRAFSDRSRTGRLVAVVGMIICAEDAADDAIAWNGFTSGPDRWLSEVVRDEGGMVEKCLGHGTAMYAVNAIGRYGTAQRFEDLERWGDTLRAVAAALPESSEVQMELAKGSVNAINHYGTAQRFEDLERWGDTLRAVAAALPESSEVQLELAKGSVNAISDYGTAQRFEDLERWGDTLRGALPPALRSEEQIATLQQIYEILGNLFKRDELPQLRAHIDWIEKRYGELLSAPEGGSFADLVSLLKALHAALPDTLPMLASLIRQFEEALPAEAKQRFINTIMEHGVNWEELKRLANDEGEDDGDSPRTPTDPGPSAGRGEKRNF